MAIRLTWKSLTNGLMHRLTEMILTFWQRDDVEDKPRPVYVVGEAISAIQYLSEDNTTLSMIGGPDIIVVGSMRDVCIFVGSHVPAWDDTGGMKEMARPYYHYEDNDA